MRDTAYAGNVEWLHNLDRLEVMLLPARKNFYCADRYYLLSPLEDTMTE